jgi:hypothetical protein
MGNGSAGGVSLQSGGIKPEAALTRPPALAPRQEWGVDAIPPYSSSSEIQAGIELSRDQDSAKADAIERWLD